MILGAGTDLMAVHRLRHVEGDKLFLAKVFTERERLEAASRDRTPYHYCTRFAGKEAVFKALGISPDEMRLGEIEILAGEYGRPYVTLHGMTKEAAERSGVKTVHLSLSWEEEYALAFAVATDETEKKGV